jgi:hypothetical protein
VLASVEKTIVVQLAFANAHDIKKTNYIKLKHFESANMVVHLKSKGWRGKKKKSLAEGKLISPNNGK